MADLCGKMICSASSRGCDILTSENSIRNELRRRPSMSEPAIQRVSLQENGCSRTFKRLMRSCSCSRPSQVTRDKRLSAEPMCSPRSCAIRDARLHSKNGTLQRAGEALKDLQTELNKPQLNSPPQTQSPGQDGKPIPVEVRQPPPTALESLVALISPLLRPRTTTGIVAIFVIFILLQREDLRNRSLIFQTTLIRTVFSYALSQTASRAQKATLSARRLTNGGDHWVSRA
jgi:hypothetical protein